MIPTIEGNILDIAHGIICHQVNCQKVAGAGLALQMRQKWPDWYNWFVRVPPKLGDTMFYFLDLDEPLVIANLYAQATISRHNEQVTDYQALASCLKQVEAVRGVVEMSTSAELQIYLPYKIGCGLGGGDWGVVEKMIEDCVTRATIIKLPNAN